MLIGEVPGHVSAHESYCTNKMCLDTCSVSHNYLGKLHKTQVNINRLLAIVIYLEDFKAISLWNSVQFGEISNESSYLKVSFWDNSFVWLPVLY